MSDIDDWHSSRKAALICGRQMRPQTMDGGFVTAMSLGQAYAYPLEASDGSAWILKKFKPSKVPDAKYVDSVRALVPQMPQTSCGYQRRVLTPSDLGTGADLFALPEFGQWLSGTILMPRINAQSWGSLLAALANFRIRISQIDRANLAQRLARTVLRLETDGVSHRDLSDTNLLVSEDRSLHLIDWDALFHSTLVLQHNTTMGTDGYRAPWLLEARHSWCPGADRFALAVCIAELLIIQPGIDLRGEGLFAQAELGRDAKILEEVTRRLSSLGGQLASLFRNAWQAGSFDNCPSPADWLAELAHIGQSGAPVVEEVDVTRRSRGVLIVHQEEASRREPSDTKPETESLVSTFLDNVAHPFGLFRWRRK